MVHMLQGGVLAAILLQWQWQIDDEAGCLFHNLEVRWCQLMNFKMILLLFCAVRLTQKWYAIPYLKEVWTRYIWNNSSIISLIYHSPQNTRIFRKYVTWFHSWMNWLTDWELNSLSFWWFYSYSLVNIITRWKKTPSGTGKLEISALQSIVIPAQSSLRHASSCTFLPWFMQQWSLLSTTTQVVPKMSVTEIHGHLVQNVRFQLFQ